MTTPVEEAVAELRTLRDLIRWGVSRLHEVDAHFGHGTDNAVDEAVYLALHALHLPPDVLDPYLDARLTETERRAVAELLWRRVSERQPAAYLIREAWFAGLAFYVDERVLVPRSPIAELIEARFEPWVDPDAVTAVLDIGTGGGCIAVAAALAFPGARVDAADVDPDALAVAEENIRRFGVEGRVRAVRSDLFEGVAGNDYDIIVSNPPYVDRPAMEALPAEYRHEPAAALAAGEEGLDLVLPMLRDAAAHLRPGGILVVEVGHSAEALQRRLPEVPFHWLEFERGGEGVFLLTEADLRSHADRLAESA